MTDDKIASDRKILDVFGGNSKLAAALGLDRRTVSNWRIRGISAAGRYQIKALAARKRLALPKGFMA